MIENGELYLKILGGIITSFIAYHRYMITLLDLSLIHI